MSASDAKRAYPVQIELERERHLRIVWDDGRETAISLAELRRQCPCAACRADREKRSGDRLALLPAGVDAASAVLADDACLVGRYALRIRWKDGHDTGIFDFGLLRRLGEQARPAAER
jgi:DUF971 family protein